MIWVPLTKRLLEVWVFKPTLAPASLTSLGKLRFGMAQDMVLLWKPWTQPHTIVGRLLEFQGTWIEEPTPLELSQVAALTNKINILKEHGLIGVYVAVCWPAHRVIPLKKQVHLGWEYSGVQDPTQETNEKISPEHLVKLLIEMFQYTTSWPADKKVRFCHIWVERVPVKHSCYY
jgi:hypothetical protein